MNRRTSLKAKEYYEIYMKSASLTKENFYLDTEVLWSVIEMMIKEVAVIGGQRGIATKCLMCRT